MKYAILLAVLLPLNATALVCQNTGSCADSRLNQTYEIKKEIRAQGRETRRAIRDESRRTQNQIQEVERMRPHRARRELLRRLDRE